MAQLQKVAQTANLFRDLGIGRRGCVSLPNAMETAVLSRRRCQASRQPDQPVAGR
jgi:hypothetical protein